MGGEVKYKERNINWTSVWSTAIRRIVIAGAKPEAIQNGVVSGLLRALQ